MKNEYSHNMYQIQFLQLVNNELKKISWWYIKRIWILQMTNDVYLSGWSFRRAQWWFAKQSGGPGSRRHRQTSVGSSAWASTTTTQTWHGLPSWRRRPPSTQCQTTSGTIVVFILYKSKTVNVIIYCSITTRLSAYPKIKTKGSAYF